MDVTKYREKINAAIKQEDGLFGNEVLYRMCRENPKHEIPDVVSGKIWLIGRAYAAAIERRRSKKKINDSFYKEEVGPKLKDPQLDTKLENLAYDKVTRSNTPEILSLHKYLSDRIREITDLDKRSLCSKYLHFHRPALFFIYDSRVATAMRKIYLGKVGNSDDLLKKPQEYDNEYAKFFCKAFLLKEEIENAIGQSITPRHLDNFLINEANNNLRI